MKVDKLKPNAISGFKGYAIHVSPEEALDLIISLTEQLRAKNANAKRAEHFTKKGEYVSIYVDFFDRA